MNEDGRKSIIETVLIRSAAWMNDYIKSLYSRDEEIQRMMLSKKKHTGQVRSICRSLALHLHFSPSETALAELMGLLHDTGRFRQFTLYRTFNDAISVDHAALGLEIIEKTALLQPLSKDEQAIVTFAIQNHNKKEIAWGKEERQNLFARLLRDADKLDIYRVLEPLLAPSDGHGISPAFLEKFSVGEQADYTMIHTFDDRKLVRLMWVYDINFSWTLQRIVERGYIDKIIHCLPVNEAIETGIRHLQAYVAQKCATPDI